MLFVGDAWHFNAHPILSHVSKGWLPSSRAMPATEALGLKATGQDKEAAQRASTAASRPRPEGSTHQHVEVVAQRENGYAGRHANGWGNERFTVEELFRFIRRAPSTDGGFCMCANLR